jgi:multicomponent Na+:H+ antiporter subunit F
MNVFLVAALVLLVCLAPCLAGALRGSPFDRLVPLEVAGTISPLVLLMLSAGLERQPFADLALVLGVLAFAGSAAYARFMERRV